MIFVEETFQALPAFLTQPTRRRSGTGSCESMTVPLAVVVRDHEHSTDTNGNAHQYVQNNGGQMNGVRAGVQQLAAMSTAQQQAGRTTAADAQQELLARTTSSGPVTTKIHAAAICCKHLLSDRVLSSNLVLIATCKRVQHAAHCQYQRPSLFSSMCTVIILSHTFFSCTAGMEGSTSNLLLSLLPLLPSRRPYGEQADPQDPGQCAWRAVR
jgi:hypothetical protein